MAIEEICNTSVATIERGATLLEVSQLMQEKHVGSVVVTEISNGKRVPCGIVTDRDLALAIGSSQKPQNINVEDIMQSNPITARVGDGVFEVIVKMRKNGIKRLPILNDEGLLFGIVCADDLLNLMGEEINNLSKITKFQIRKEKGTEMPAERNA